MVRLIHTPRVIRTQAQREEVNKLTAELKTIQANPRVHQENLVHLVNHIIKFHEKVQDLIWASDVKMIRNWMKLKVLRNVLFTDYQKGILDFLVDKKRKVNKHYNFVVHKFVLDYLKGLNVNRELEIQKHSSLNLCIISNTIN